MADVSNAKARAFHGEPDRDGWATPGTSERPMLPDDGLPGPPPYHGRCDCPCHHGADVFHIVSCCGSVLGRGQRAMRLRSAHRDAGPE